MAGIGGAEAVVEWRRRWKRKKRSREERGGMVVV